MVVRVRGGRSRGAPRRRGMDSVNEDPRGLTEKEFPGPNCMEKLVRNVHHVYRS